MTKYNLPEGMQIYLRPFLEISKLPLIVVVSVIIAIAICGRDFLNAVATALDHFLNAFATALDNFLDLFN